MSKGQITRRLKVNLSELEEAFEDTSWERSYYLDLETGETVMVTEEIRQQLEQIYEEAPPEEIAGEEVDITPILNRLSLPEWEKDALREANQIEQSFGVRYISVPHAQSSDAYGDMEEFITAVRNQRLQDRLWQAISGQRPFRRFKDVLADNPIERERWFSFNESRLRERVLEWLEEEGIEPIEGPQ
ncbi:MAG TPA: hypothetical protein DCY61_03515 [Dehalococcoidia bacterium]|nr:hypothetical protein [Dehalococcoidia bacterium]